MYKLSNLSEEEHDIYVKNHSIGDMCQLSSWAKVKSPDWYSKKIAIKNTNNEVAGVAQLLFRKLFFNYTICYIPRGFICDYNNLKLVKKMFEEIKMLAKKEKAIHIFIDPYIKREGNENIVSELKKLGFHHQGYSGGLDNFQPRFTMVVDLTDGLKTVESNFVNATRRAIKKAVQYGLEYEICDVSEIDKFDKLMKETGKRDHFGTRDKNYFSKIVKEMSQNDGALFVLIKIRPKKVYERFLKIQNDFEKQLEALKDRIENSTSEKSIEKTNRKIDEIKILMKKNQNSIDEIKPFLDRDEMVLSGAINIFCGEKSYYLYAASSNELRFMLPNYFMNYKLMEESIKRGCKSYDFGGVSGSVDPDDEHFGLYQFKSRFGAKMHENIGQFDYVLKPIIYKLFKLAIKIRRKL